MIASLVDRTRAMMLGLALGDGMGRSVEQAGWPEIQSRFGPQGLLDPDAPLDPGDDTSIVVAVAEALVAGADDGPDVLMAEVVARLVGWRTAAGDNVRDTTSAAAIDRLQSGVSFRESAVAGSKDSGAAPRAAPVGVVFAPYPLLLREMSILVARTTHGHPTSHAAAVTVAVSVREALQDAELQRWPEAAARSMSGMACEEMVGALGRVREALSMQRDPESMEQLGQGFLADEAVAMAYLAFARHPESFADTLRCAVNHGGKSSTVGCIAGALCGARAGFASLPEPWLELLSGRERLVDLADRLVAARQRLR